MNSNAITMPKTVYGLYHGSHPLPVKGYVFPRIDALDITKLNLYADMFVREHCNIRRTWGVGPAQVDRTYVEKYVGDPIDVLVTGPTTALTALMWACACYGVPLTLWHFDRETGDYTPQRFHF